MLLLLFLSSISGIAGFFGGMTGTGGIIMPPLMIEFCGFSPHLAMATAQASYFIPSGIAVLLFIRKGQFDWRVAFPMAFSGFLASFVAANYLKPLMDPTLLSVFFALCIMLSGAVMLRPNTRTMERPLAPPRRMPVLVLLGLSVGLMAGITGSGSNAILVPAMVFFGLDILSVLGACQFFAVLVSVSGTVGNALHLDMDYVAVAFMVVAQVLGMFLGVGLAQRMETARLKRCVALVCFLAGLFMLVKAVYAML